MLWFKEGTSGASLIMGTLKSAAVIAVLSFVAANWLSSRDFDRSEMSRLARNAQTDPVTTGSIAGRAGATKLDPCQVPAR